MILQTVDLQIIFLFFCLQKGKTKQLSIYYLFDPSHEHKNLMFFNETIEVITSHTHTHTHISSSIAKVGTLSK